LFYVFPQVQNYNTLLNIIVNKKMLLSTRKLQNIKIFAVINRAAVNKKSKSINNEIIILQK
ncbi:MAG: hypothetical protein N5823_02315, partial [Lactobacillus iners]|nr:hypothetical protein [Lactobacillus iners]